MKTRDLTINLDPVLLAALESLASFAGVGSVSYTGPTAFGVS